MFGYHFQFSMNIKWKCCNYKNKNENKNPPDARSQNDETVTEHNKIFIMNNNPITAQISLLVQQKSHCDHYKNVFCDAFIFQ